jgi:hypothetical protein
MNEGYNIEQQDHSDDFWPGFVDILSGLILIFSFLILVAGVVIAVIYQTYSTVKLPPTKFTHVLAIIQQSPLLVKAQYDIIEEVKRESNLQILVRQTKQQLEDIAEKTNRVLIDFPDLKRKIVQEIRFLQKEIRLVKASPPPEGKTQKALDNQGGRLADFKEADNIPPLGVKNWEVLDSAVAGGSKDFLFIGFNTPQSLPPTEEMDKKLRIALREWLRANPNNNEPKIAVANAVVPYAGIAPRDSLRRALFLRNLMKTYKIGILPKIIAVENDRPAHPNGWIEIKP